MTPTTGNAEITLRIDADGVIEVVDFGLSLESESGAAWVGKSWAQTVCDATRSKVHRLVEDARATGVAGFRQVNHFLPSGREIPVEYTAVRVDDEGSLVAVGRSLHLVSELQQRLVQAQQALERDHWRLREIESRYRMLFHRSPEAIVVLESDTFRIVDANPEAHRLFGIEEHRAADAGLDLASVVSNGDRFLVESRLRQVRATGDSESFSIRLREDDEPLECRATPMSGPAGTEDMVLVHLRPIREAAGEVG